MKKPKKSSTTFVVGKGNSLERPPSNVPSMPPETLAFMRESEAREWIARYKRKVGEVGAVSGRSWWEQTKRDIARVRGEEGLRSLIKLMEQERAKDRAGLSGTGAVPQPKPRQALDGNTQGQDPGQGDGLLEDQSLPQAKPSGGN